VTLQYYTSLNQPQQKLFDPMVAQPFEQAHPDLTIEVIESAGPFYAKLTTMVAAGTPPDVVWEAYPEAYLGKLITDVTSYVNRDKLDSSIYPQYAMDYDGIWQGKILGLPNQTGGNWPVMPFNHNLFAAVGLPDPPDHWGEASWNYSAFVDACQKLTKISSDGTPQSFAINDFGLGTVMLWWGLRYGGQWLSDDYTTITCDSPQMIEGLQQLFDLPLKYKVMPKPGQLKAVFGDSNAMNLLKAGKLAMTIDSGGDMYTVATDDQAGADLMFGAQPTFPVSTGDDQDVDPNGLALGTKHPDEGWLFIRFQADTPGWAISRGNLPARQDLMPAWEKALWGGGVGQKARVQVYEDSINHTAKKDPIGHLSNWRALYTQFIVPEFTKVWAGQAAVSDVLHALKPQLQTQVVKGMPA
jgi:ABC-type glycerol-3-phosphate transport system substrate-binding protein